MNFSNFSEVTLDDFDWDILRELQSDARMSYAEIGRRVELSSTTVAERMRRLENLGIIEGYRVQLNYEMLGVSILAFVHLSIERQVITPAEMTRYAESRSEILELYSLIGDDCYLFKVGVQSMKRLDDLLSGMRRYGKTRTSIVLASLTKQEALAVAGENG